MDTNPMNSNEIVCACADSVSDQERVQRNESDLPSSPFACTTIENCPRKCLVKMHDRFRV